MSSWHDSATIWVTAEIKQISLGLSFVLRGCCFLFVPVELILVCSLRGLCAVCHLNLFPTRVLSSSAKKLLSQAEERGALSLLNSRGAAGNAGERKLFVTHSIGLIAGSCALSLAPVCLRHLFFTVAVKMGWDWARLWVIRDGSHRRRFIWMCMLLSCMTFLCAFLYCLILILTC